MYATNSRVALAGTLCQWSRFGKEAGVAHTPVGKELWHYEHAAIDQPEEKECAPTLWHTVGERSTIVERCTDV